MAPRISRMLYNRQVLDQLRRGVETEHFRARVTWPQGFDGMPKVTVSMNHTEFCADEWGSAEDNMHETLTDELNELYRQVSALTHTLSIFSLDRENVREGMNPNIGRQSCYSPVYERKMAAV